ncbi:lymphokine-activated killer T-cell-originated protein kinase [Ischnura elegans]|uniref:lymphokine-activated killer T-cell-originated protein kinase n=1 Tax=Ischnura elegans TaxID=197161 RepID=UPI001ED89F7E|nr:lymphokine-activated killer T-cell-originated protein kinase [Ischnura elegans]XP_046396358.1 lymphokine-activated killer T-cell-originated protein kinase [Ischnura elegans]
MEDFKTPKAKRARKSAIVTPAKGVTPVKIPPSPFMEKVGWGTAVTVYRMERSPKVGCIRSPWAIKRVIHRNSTSKRPRLSSDNEISVRLCKEAEILKSLSHPNIVGFRAFTKSSDGRVTLAMEDGQRSLLSLIEERLEKVENSIFSTDSLNSTSNSELIVPDDPFPAWAVLRVGSALASALSYLHNEALLVHGDLKSDNVLVKGDFDAIKLCDFGVSLKVDKNGEALVDEQYIGTRHWLPPEVITLEVEELEWEEGDAPLPKVTVQADMYSYALTLWEMLSLKFPHCPTNEDEEEESANDSFEENLLLGTRPPFPVGCLEDPAYTPVVEIIHCCSDEDPLKRPTSQQALEWLQLIEASGAMKKPAEEQENVVPNRNDAQTSKLPTS